MEKKGLAAKLDDLSSIPEAPNGKRRKLTCSDLYFDLHIHFMHTHTHTNRVRND